MQDLEPNNKSDFVIEKIKERPINKKKLLRRTVLTASMAVMFGLIACFTFLILEPVISNSLYPQEEPPKQFIFPEDEEEMKPEEMLSGNKEDDQEDISSSASDKKKRQEILAAMDYYQWDIADYDKMYSALGEFAIELKDYLVTVTARESSGDWLDDANSSKTRCSGLVVGNNGKEVLILTNYNQIKSADSLWITFFDGYRVEADLKQKHNSSDIAILSVNIVDMGEHIRQVKIAPLGTSNVESYLLRPVIAIGKTVGTEDSVHYGFITSEKNEVDIIDANFEVLITDIYGSSMGSGFLFNLKGQMIGMITSKKPSSDVRNQITAFEIGDLKRLISRLSNGYGVPSVGIIGTMVSEEIHQDGNVPYGIYIKDVVMNSPAMKAGIQPGDVVVAVNDKPINNFRDYFNPIVDLESNTTIELTIKRFSVNHFKEIRFQIVLGKAE